MRIKTTDIMLVGVIIGPVVFHVADRAPRLWFVDVAIALTAIYTFFVAGAGKIEFTGAEKWLLGYLVVVLVTTIMMPDALRAMDAVKLRIMPILTLVVAYNSFRTQDDLRHTQVCLSLCAAIIACFLLFNVYIYSWGYARMAEEHALKAYSFTHLGRSNYLASIFVLLLPFCFSLFSIRKPLLGAATSLIVVMGTVATQSRAGVGCILIVSLLWLFMMSSTTNKFKTIFLALAMIGSMIAGIILVRHLLPEYLIQNFLDKFIDLEKQWEVNPDSIARIRYAKGAIKVFLSSPIIGRGPNAGIEFDTGIVGGSAHNLFLEFLMQTGIVGFTLYMGYLFKCGRNLYSLRKVFPGGPQRTLVATITSSFLIAIINTTVEPSFWAPSFSCMFTIVIAMGFAQTKIASNEQMRAVTAWPAANQEMAYRR